MFRATLFYRSAQLVSTDAVAKPDAAYLLAIVTASAE